MAKFDAKRFSRMDWAVVGAAGVSFICLFLPWYGWSAGPYSFSVSGWSTSYGCSEACSSSRPACTWRCFGPKVNLAKMPLTPAVVVLGAAALGTLIVVLRWITLPAVTMASSATARARVLASIWTIIAGVVQVVAAVGLFRSSGGEASLGEVGL